MATSPGHIPNLASADTALGSDERAQALVNLGLAVSSSAWTPVCGLQPAIAHDFVNDRYHGGASLIDIATTRSVGLHRFKDAAGAVLQFAENEVRRSDLGLYYDADDTMTAGGVLLRMFASAPATPGTLLVETGISEVVENTYDVETGPDGAVIMGGNGNLILFNRSGNPAAIGTGNGVTALGAASNAPGNGRYLSTGIQAMALRWNGTARSLCLGGGTIVSDANGIGAYTTVYIGRRSGGLAGSGIIRSIRYFPFAMTDAQMQQVCLAGPAERKFTVWGDSLAGGAGVGGATHWFDTLASSFNPDGIAFAAGVGGDTTRMCLDRFNTIVPGAQADSDPARHREWINLFWTGHNDGAAADTLAGLKAMIDQLTGEKRYLVLLPLQNTAGAVGSAGNLKVLAVRAAILATFPASRIFDAPAILAAAAPGDANNASGYTPGVYLADTIHLNQAGQDVIAAALKAQMIRLRW